MSRLNLQEGCVGHSQLGSLEAGDTNDEPRSVGAAWSRVAAK